MITNNYMHTTNTDNMKYNCLPNFNLNRILNITYLYSILIIHIVIYMHNKINVIWFVIKIYNSFKY